MAWLLGGLWPGHWSPYEDLLDTAVQVPSGLQAYQQMAERLRALLPEDYHEDFMYAAAELLVWGVTMPPYDAERYPRLDEDVLRILAKERVLVGGILEQTGPTPEWEAYPSTFFGEVADEDDPDEELHVVPEEFRWENYRDPNVAIPLHTRYIMWLQEGGEFGAVRGFLDGARQLAEDIRLRTPREKRRKKGKKSTLSLQGISPEKVVGECGGLLDAQMPLGRNLTPPVGEEDELHGARVFEQEVAADPVFLSDLERVVAASERASARTWTYVHDGRSFVKHDGDDEESTTYLRLLLGMFCQCWCLASVSTEQGSFEIKGVFITAERLRVTLASQGTSVFIPRYYGWTHVENRCGGNEGEPQPSDFVPMKKALDRFPKIRLQPSENSRIKMAGRLYRKYKDQGMPRPEAWERARREAGLSVEQMTKNVTGKPKT